MKAQVKKVEVKCGKSLAKKVLAYTAVMVLHGTSLWAQQVAPGAAGIQVSRSNEIQASIYEQFLSQAGRDVHFQILLTNMRGEAERALNNAVRALNSNPDLRPELTIMQSGGQQDMPYEVRHAVGQRVDTFLGSRRLTRPVTRFFSCNARARQMVYNGMPICVGPASPHGESDPRSLQYGTGFVTEVRRDATPNHFLRASSTENSPAGFTAVIDGHTVRFHRINVELNYQFQTNSTSGPTFSSWQTVCWTDRHGSNEECGSINQLEAIIREERSHLSSIIPPARPDGGNGGGGGGGAIPTRPNRVDGNGGGGSGGGQPNSFAATPQANEPVAAVSAAESVDPHGK